LGMWPSGTGLPASGGSSSAVSKKAVLLLLWAGLLLGYGDLTSPGRISEIPGRTSHLARHRGSRV